MVRALVILIAVLLSSCQTLTLQKTLDTAERQLLECPDSALATVRTINHAEALRPSLRAHYGVIYSAALDKNRINITSDSLIRFSVDYYDIFGSPEQRMRAYYYLGRTQKHAGEIMPATLSFLDAAQYTDQVDDNYLKGLLYSELGEVYILHMQYKKAYNYFEQSYNYYKAEDMPQHQAYQLYQMGRIDYLMTDINLAEQHLNQAKELAITSNFDKLAPFCNMLLVDVYTTQLKYDKAYELLQQISPAYYTNELYSTLISAIIVLHYKGEKKRAKELLNRGWELAKNSNDSCYMHYCLSRVYFLDKKYKESATENTKWRNINLSWTAKNLIRTDAGHLENELLEQKAQFIQAKARRIKISLIALIIFISAAFICSFIYKHITTKRKLAEMSRTISQYAESNKSFEHDIANYKAEIGELNLSNFKEKFATIDHLCATYYQYIDSPKKQINIYKEVVSTIEELSNDSQMFANLEKDINNSFDNILLNLQAEYPNISNNEYKLACYICAGFSSQTICVLLKCDSDALYRRVYRLREKVRALNDNTKYSILLHK